MIKYADQMAKFAKELDKLGHIQDRDPMAKNVITMINALYASDNIELDVLQRYAVKLLGAYSYLGLKAAKHDSYGDIAEETLKAAKSSLVNAYSSDPSTGVTQARGMAAEELMDDLVKARIAKQEADEYAMITKVAEKAISLIQSILRRAESERRSTKFQ